MGQLPLEIALHIIGEYFDQKSITPYSRVCSTWRNTIIKYSEFWEQISFGTDLPILPGVEKEILPPYMLLPSICQYIQELEIFDKSQVTNHFSKILLLKII